jgi:hypothetical protein
MSRPSRSSRRGKCDAVPENRELVTPESPPLSATVEMRTMPPQTAVILWILIILALIVPAVAGMRLHQPVDAGIVAAYVDAQHEAEL